MVANWAGPRVSTVVLHRPNPVAREMPGFIGFFARREGVAEREGFSTPLLLPTYEYCSLRFASALCSFTSCARWSSRQA
jgi:hypothetical protein